MLFLKPAERVACFVCVKIISEHRACASSLHKAKVGEKVRKKFTVKLLLSCEFLTILVFC